jgi:putative DNA primase/helicase
MRRIDPTRGWMDSHEPPSPRPDLAEAGGARAAAADVISDNALALRLSERLAHDARYVAPWKRWLLFDGTAWRPDESLRIFSEARATCRAAADETRDARAKARIGSAATIAAVARLARDDRRHLAAADQWDADPLLLNTPAGTVDLRTGDMRAHRRDDYITRTTAVAPGDGCPLFLAFLDRIFAGDAALIAFVQRALGYALTGEIAEHALFFLHGTGGNGKGVLLNTVLDILGGYAAVAPIEPFLAASRAPHPADLAMLQGARLVVVQETAHGSCWHEARIKALSGDNPVVARRARGEVFAYRPRFKLWIAGNEKPHLRTVDMGIRRRIKLVPFDVTIPEAEMDHHLRSKLRAELPGILAWMIEGCRAWQRIGLAAPPAVLEATRAYLADEDVFGAWLEDKVEPAPADATETASALFSSWCYYAGAQHVPAGSRIAFGQAMQARGFKPCRIGKERTRGYQGLAFRGTAPARPSTTHAAMAALAGRMRPVEGA